MRRLCHAAPLRWSPRPPPGSAAVASTSTSSALRGAHLTSTSACRAPRCGTCFDQGVATLAPPRGCSSMARVPAFQAGYAGSIPVTRSNALRPFPQAAGAVDPQRRHSPAARAPCAGDGERLRARWVTRNRRWRTVHRVDRECRIKVEMAQLYPANGLKMRRCLADVEESSVEDPARSPRDRNARSEPAPAHNACVGVGASR